MHIHFYKYHGTGNDFVIIDNRDSTLKLDQKQVAFLCNRHFGVGADGLMLLEKEGGYDFKMVYYNSDGNESTMCGNGGRCITAFAQKLGVVTDTAKFIAIDGPHHAELHDDGTIALGMQNVSGITFNEGHTILNTGSPHYVTWVNNLDQFDVFAEGRAIRNQERFQPDGLNVNFVTVIDNNNIKVRTYERGVEDETLSCGTGVTACAIATVKNETGSFNTLINTPGGNLAVSFTKPTFDSAIDVILKGPAQLVFEGDIEI